MELATDIRPEAAVASEAPTSSAPPPPPLPPAAPPRAPAPPKAPVEPRQKINVGGNNRNALLDQIREGRQLREVRPNEALPSLGALSNEESNSLAGILAKAMASRRLDIKQDLHEEHDDDSWDD